MTKLAHFVAVWDRLNDAHRVMLLRLADEFNAWEERHDERPS